MEVDVCTETVIRRPVAEVAAIAGDPGRTAEWYENITSVEWETQPPAAIGSRIAFVAHFVGRRIAYTYEIIELVPGQRLVMRISQGPFPMETTYIWEPAEGGTRMILRNRGTPSGFGSVAAPIMARAMRRANTKDLAALRRLLEDGKPERRSRSTG